MTKQNTAKAAQPAADLRQRAARARDAAGRFIKRSPVDAAAAASPAAAEIMDGWRAWDATLGKPEGDPEADAAYERAAERRDALLDAAEALPPTPDNVLAKALAICWLEYVAEVSPGKRRSEQPFTGRISLDIHEAITGKVSARVPDKVIDWYAAPPGFMASPAIEPFGFVVIEKGIRIELERLHGIALAEFERRADVDPSSEWVERLRRTLRLDALQKAALGEASTAVGPHLVEPHPDATLLALGAEFMAAWAAEEANEADADEGESRTCLRIIRQIVQTPAVTAAGYGIKALLLARLDSDATGPHAPIAPSGPVDSWWNVLRQVQQGAARIAKAPPPVSPETGYPITDRTPPGPCAPVRPDLSSLPIHQLARLYPVVVRAGEAIGSSENAPCFRTEDRLNRTSAGCIVNWEAQRLDRLASEIALEISRRQPEDVQDRKDRAETMLLHALQCGGLTEHPELIVEINATWGA